MKEIVILKLGLIGALSLFVAGCSDLAKAPNSQAQKVPAPVDRYQLQEVRNGNAEMTALLDRQTGYVWLLTKVTDAKPDQEDEVFAPTTVWPQDSHRSRCESSEVYRPCPASGPLGLFTVSACNPLPAKERDS